MVSKGKSVKDELKEEPEEQVSEETLEIANTDQQKIELQEEAKSDELVLPFERENLRNYLWRLLIIKKVEIRDAVLKSSNEPVQITYLDGYTISDPELEKKLIDTIVDQQQIPIDLIKAVNEKKHPIYTFSTSQGVYYSALRSVIPKLKTGSVLVGVCLQESEYPQPTIILCHPSKLPELKARFEALNKGSKR